MKKQFTLGKEERLKSRKQIDHLFQQGHSFNLFPFRVFYSFVDMAAEDTPLRVGIGASTRNYKKAVDRNRIKRLGREAWRLQKNELRERLTKTDRRLNVFLIYTAKEIESFDVIKQKVAAVIIKLNKIIDENTGANP